MKAKEALKLLKISRVTLWKYVKTKKLRVQVLPNNDYDYNEEDVLKLAGYAIQRDSVIYARVSTQKQKKDLENQINLIQEYANQNGYNVTHIYQDIASGLNYDRKDFKTMLLQILDRKIKYVFIKDKDRLTRVSYDLWKSLFKIFNCELICINEELNSDNEEKEIFADIISLIHCFAMRMYSSRRKRKLQITEEDLENEISENS